MLQASPRTSAARGAGVGTVGCLTNNRPEAPERANAARRDEVPHLPTGRFWAQVRVWIQDLQGAGADAHLFFDLQNGAGRAERPSGKSGLGDLGAATRTGQVSGCVGDTRGQPPPSGARPPARGPTPGFCGRGVGTTVQAVPGAGGGAPVRAEACVSTEALSPPRSPASDPRLDACCSAGGARSSRGEPSSCDEGAARGRCARPAAQPMLQLRRPGGRRVRRPHRPPRWW